MTEYEPVIGLEVHCQLKTRTKMFTGATTVFGREPNSQTDVLTLGLPGSLPVINAHAVDLAIRAALALGCTVHERSKFDRKHYFYPDLPKGYQITQFDEPYCTEGGVTIDMADGSTKVIGLTRIHMEEDAGKLIHQEGGPYSEVDLNRAGVPLIEIVSNPELRSAAEAYAYLVELKRALKWVGVSDCEMQEGSLRCDANVSVRPKGQQAFGVRAEIKNLNSFRAVESAIEHEIATMIALNKAGRIAEIVQCTKLWDPNTKTTKVMRSKENAADYRYFPDPDLPPLVIPASRIAQVQTTMPELPRVREKRFIDVLGLDVAAARELTADNDVAEYFEALVSRGIKARLAANWTREEAIRLANEQHRPLTEAAPIAVMAEIISLVDAGKVARVIAKDQSGALFAGNEAPEAYFTSRGMIQVQDAGQLAAWVAQVITQEDKVVADIRGGKVAAIGRLVGVTMKLSGGTAEPNAVKVELMKQLGV